MNQYIQAKEKEISNHDMKLITNIFKQNYSIFNPV